MNKLESALTNMFPGNAFCKYDYPVMARVLIDTYRSVFTETESHEYILKTAFKRMDLPTNDDEEIDAQVYNLVLEQLVHRARLPPNMGDLKAVCMSDDAIACADVNGIIYIYRNNDEPITPLDANIKSVAFTKTGMLVAPTRCSVYTWDLKDDLKESEMILDLNPQGGVSMSAFSMSNDGATAVLLLNSVIGSLDLETMLFRSIYQVEETPEYVQLAISNDRKRVAFIVNSSVYVYDVDKKERSRIEVRYPLSIAFSHSGDLLAIGTREELIVAHLSGEYQTSMHMGDEITIVKFSPVENKIAMVRYDKVMIAMDGMKLRSFDHEDVIGIDWSSDGSRLVTASRDGTVNVWSV
jgi:WD40 repeat protein